MLIVSKFSLAFYFKRLSLSRRSINPDIDFQLNSFCVQRFSLALEKYWCDQSRLSQIKLK